MLDIFYTIFIFPIEQIIELFYIFVFRICLSPALSILGVSFVVSILTLPLYFMAEKHQRSERDIQKQMQPEVDNIKAVFSGDERFMRLAVYYRQNGYHPLLSLRSSISLIIQIPFFIAAYHFLINLEAIKNVSFGPIMDLAKPDAFLTVNNFSINILPILMTLINIISAMLYLKESSAKDKIQLYGMAALFLILLYNSPSGMVLYWTGNNLFSLVKNGIQKTKQPKLITHILISVFCFLLLPYLLFIHKGLLIKRISLAVIFVLIPLLPFIFKFYSKIKKQFLFKNSLVLVNRSIGGGGVQNDVIFILSLAIIFLLGGLVIPSSLIASSVQEFSLIENDKSPLSFIANTALQSFGMFLLWPLCLYFIFPGNIRQKISKITVILAFITMINIYLFPGKYGFVTLMFTFSEKVSSTMTANLFNLLIIVITILLAMILISRFQKAILSILVITACALVLIGTVNSIKIRNEYLAFQVQLSRDNSSAYSTVYQFSKTGKNVLLIMLDRAISGYIPYIFEEKPELYNSFDGFTWYRNTVSFGGWSNFGIPGLFGGYEYTPLEMQARIDTPLVEKHNEALLLLPKIFLDQGFEVTVTDPPYANYSWIADLSIFDDYPQINAANVISKYNDSWLLNNKELSMTEITNIISNIKYGLIRFSFFKFAPLLFRNYIYDGGKWLSTGIGQSLQTTLNNYIALDILPDITLISENEYNTYNVLTNDLTHDPSYLQAPDYIPANEITNRGSGPFAHEEHYHINIAALLLIGKWFDFLKENDVYDNTRIIIASDHGRNIHSQFPDNIILPNGECLEAYTALLMVKDFNAHGTLLVDDSFMTNADVPLIALKDIVENQVNPWTGKKIMSDKEDGITLTTSRLWSVDKHPKYWFDIKPDEWLHVHTNIYDKNNWKQITYPAK
jgi:YidC/Oxa1 family membrane protein insertase